MIKLLKNFKVEILVFLLFVLLRLPNLGHDNFNTDVWRWKSRIYDFGQGVFTGNFEATIQMYHPGVTLMWIGTAAVKVYNLYYRLTTGANPPDNQIHTVFELDFVQNLFIVFVTAFTLSCIFHVLKKLFSEKYALISFIFLALEPFYAALTRVVHLEGLMSTFMIASFIYAYYFLVSSPRKYKYLYISSLFSTLAILTKSSSLFMLPFIGLVLFLYEWKRTKKFFSSVITSLKQYFRWLLLLIVLFFILWPGMWVAPQRALTEYFMGISDIGIEGGHDQIYFGQFVTDPGPWFYMLVLFFRSSIPLLFGVVGFLVIFRKLDKKVKDFSIYLALFFLLYLIEITIPTKKLDRYILPSIMCLSLMSGFFFSHITQNLKSKYILIPIAFLILQIGTVIAIHPDYLSYYNPLGGGMGVGIYVLEPKWMIGQREVIAYFKGYIDRGEYKAFGETESLYNMKRAQYSEKVTVAFPEKYYTQIWPFIRELGGWGVIELLTPEAVKTNFFVYPVWDDYSYKEDRFILQYVDSIKVRGVPVYKVYKRVS